MTVSLPHSRGIANALEAMAHEANLMSAGHPDHAHQYAYRAGFAAEKAKVEAYVARLEEQLEATQKALQDELDNWNPESRPTITAERDALKEQLEAREKVVADLRAALGAYRSALRSGEPESDELQRTGSAAIDASFPASAPEAPEEKMRRFMEGDPFPASSPEDRAAAARWEFVQENEWTPGNANREPSPASEPKGVR